MPLTIALCSCHSNANNARPYLQTYCSYAHRWTIPFRPRGVGIVHTLLLTSLALAPPFALPSSLTITNPVLLPSSLPRSSWHRQAQSTADFYLKVLDASTKFPRAGEKNEHIHDFVDLCIAIWERGGCLESEAPWVIDILWWATRYTFHSQRIMRHLSRLLLAYGNYLEAKRTFLLYVELVVKGRQTSAGDVSLQLKRRPTDLPAEHPEVIAEEEEAEEERGAGGDSDDDVTFLNMLVFGIRMLCRYGNEDDIGEAKRILNIALEVMGPESSKRRKGWSSVLRANVSAARGIVAFCAVKFGTWYSSFIRTSLLDLLLTPLYRARAYSAPNPPSRSS